MTWLTFQNMKCQASERSLSLKILEQHCIEFRTDKQIDIHLSLMICVLDWTMCSCLRHHPPLTN